MASRYAYVQALRTERAMYAARPDAKARRLKEIDAELAKYANEPDDRTIETAVPGPIVSGRKRRVKRTSSPDDAPPHKLEVEEVDDDAAPADDTESDEPAEPTADVETSADLG